MKLSIGEEQKKVWYITGASNGLGLNLVKQLLAAGYKVVATSDQLEELKSAVVEHTMNFLPLGVDLTKETSIQQSVEVAITVFGRIDVVVNNAGYGLKGSLEELSDHQARSNFDVNVFGTLNVIRTVMPYLKAQGSGHIFNMSSIGGFAGGSAGLGIYLAAEFAVAGLSESLAAEVRPFGINVTVVMPGKLRTHNLENAHQEAPEYAGLQGLENTAQQEAKECQECKLNRAVGAIMTIAGVEYPPLHLFLGKEAYDMADQKILSIQNNMDRWEFLAAPTELEQLLEA